MDETRTRLEVVDPAEAAVPTEVPDLGEGVTSLADFRRGRPSEDAVIPFVSRAARLEPDARVRVPGASGGVAGGARPDPAPGPLDGLGLVMELLEEWKKQEAALTELGLSEDELSAHAVTFAIGAHAGMALVQR